MSYLADTDIFGEAEAEGTNYLLDAIERFRITVSLVDQVLSSGRVLELGSNPYFITRLLMRRGLDVTCANWFGDAEATPRGVQVVTAKSGERHTFEFDHFNVERDRFPYENDSFDLVLCCEILEHLPHDPVHMLAEAHRVLRKGRGRLLLTTPNPVRLENLARMLRGDNVYEELSGYGAYGRHNREYTVRELSRLLRECGFADVVVFAVDIHPHDLTPEIRWSGAQLHGRGDNLFAVARAEGEPRWPYPEWLYSSQHALARRVRPDVRMGYNDALQTSGFHALERNGDLAFRWTGPSPGHARVTAPDGANILLRLDGYAPPPSAGSTITVLATVDGESLALKMACDGERFSLAIPVKATSGDHDVIIGTDWTWRPCDAFTSEDRRELGVRLTAVALESGAGG